MPHKDKEERKEYARLYYKKNKVKWPKKENDKEYQKLYRSNNKEYQRLYRIKNKEKIKEQQSKISQKFRQTELGKKSHIISNWKHYGILCFDFDLLYDIFLSTARCEFCNVELNTNTKTRKCLDHDHSINDRFNVRYVLCHSCNCKLR